MTSLYWCECAGGRNFGDALGPELVHRLTDRRWDTVPAADADLVVVGSILEHLPDGWSGTVAGIGAAHARTRRDLTGARVLAVRGPRTLSQIRHSGQDVVLADPGLLADMLLPDPRPKVDFSIGAIAHYADQRFSPPPGSHIIDVTLPLEQVVYEAARCSSIYSSSLHGLILADALGLPRMWALYDRVQGKGHKHKDYGESLGQPFEPGVWVQADADVVADKKAQLREVFECLK